MKRILTLLTVMWMASTGFGQWSLEIHSIVFDQNGPVAGVQITVSDQMGIFNDEYFTDQDGMINALYDLSPNFIGDVFTMVMVDCTGNTWTAEYVYNGSEEVFGHTWLYCTGNQQCGVVINNDPNAYVTTLEAVGSGVPPLGYLWDSGSTDDTYLPIQPGTYCVTITDAIGCIDTACIVVDSVNTDFICSVAIMETGLPGNPGGIPGGGVALVTTTTGYFPIQYNWSNGQTDEVIVVQDTGVYSVTITDALGCTSEAWIEVTDIPDACFVDVYFSSDLTLTALPFGHPPFDILWNNGDTSETINVEPGNEYCVVITDDAGCTSTACVFVDPNWVDTICFAEIRRGTAANIDELVAIAFGVPPYQYDWNTGDTTEIILATAYDSTYSVTITDALGCVATDDIYVDSIPTNNQCFFNLIIHSEPNSPIGNPYYAEVIPFGFPPFTIEWSNGEVGEFIQLTPDMDSICVTVTDASGCVSEGCFDIDLPNFDTCLVDVYPLCDPGQPLQFYAQPFGIPPFEYIWNTGDSTESIYGDPGVEYCVTVTDFTGCVVSNCFTLDTLVGDTINASAIFGFISTIDGDFVEGQALLIEETPSGNLAPVDTFDLIGENTEPFYFFDLVPNGRYFVQFIPSSPNFVPTYHLDAVLWTEATPIDIPPNDPGFYPIVVHSTQPLMGPGFINGYVFDEDGGLGAETRSSDPLGGALVILADAAGTPLQFAYTTPDGGFTFANLPWGTYQVFFNHLNLVPNKMFVDITPDNPAHENIIISVEDGTFITAIEDIFPSFEWNVFPNPVREQVVVSWDNLNADAEIVLRNMQGIEVSRSVVKGSDKIYTLDASAFSAGVYFIEMTANGQRSFKKITKM